ncbi:MAG: hypothetical protein NC418_07435 [Muribaculaceae bacterium]|nr:hypothetical protein [Muribaculaceae bacterium]
MNEKDTQPPTYLERTNGNYLAAAMLFISESALPGWAKTALRVLILAIVAAAILGGLLWPFLW